MAVGMFLCLSAPVDKGTVSYRIVVPAIGLNGVRSLVFTGWLWNQSGTLGVKPVFAIYYLGLNPFSVLLAANILQGLNGSHMGTT